MCDSHVTVGAASSTNGGSAHKQSDNNPLKQLGDWFGSAKHTVQDKAKQAGQWIYDNSSTISAVAGTAAVVTAFIPGVDAISPALFAVSAVTGVMAAHKDMQQGNYGAAALDALAVIPGGGAAGAGLKDARLALSVGRDAKVFGLGESAAKGGANTLFHFTSEEGRKGILESGVLNASTNPRNARYGPGQYLTDINPQEVSSGRMTAGQLARRLFGQPWAGRKTQSWVEIDVSGLPVENPVPNIFRIPGEGPLDLAGRIVSSGTF